MESEECLPHTRFYCPYQNKHCKGGGNCKDVHTDRPCIEYGLSGQCPTPDDCDLDHLLFPPCKGCEAPSQMAYCTVCREEFRSNMLQNNIRKECHTCGKPATPGFIYCIGCYKSYKGIEKTDYHQTSKNYTPLKKKYHSRKPKEIRNDALWDEITNEDTK